MAFTLATIAQFPYFADPDKGRPVFFGELFIGEVDTDPEIPGNQKTVNLRQEGTDIPAVAQPITLGAGGIAMYQGSPAQVLVDGNYSAKLLNNLGAQVWYVPDAIDGAPLTATIADQLYVNLTGDTMTGALAVPAGGTGSEVRRSSEADTLLALKSTIDSTTLTGVPAGPTAAQGTDTTQLATTAFVGANAEFGSNANGVWRHWHTDGIIEQWGMTQTDIGSSVTSANLPFAVTSKIIALCSSTSHNPGSVDSSKAGATLDGAANIIEVFTDSELSAGVGWYLMGTI